MPTISVFFGFVVQMYWRDHPPPHVHVLYQGFEALIAIDGGEVIAGALPPGALRIVRPWIERRRAELLANWERGKLLQPLERIPGADVEMIEIVKVLQVKPLGGARLWLRFSTGEEGVRDLSDVLAEGGPMVEPLRDPELFGRVFVESGVPAWPNGFDLDAIALHREMKEAGLLTPEPVA